MNVEKKPKHSKSMVYVTKTRYIKNPIIISGIIHVQEKYNQENTHGS